MATRTRAKRRQLEKQQNTSLIENNKLNEDDRLKII